MRRNQIPVRWSVCASVAPTATPSRRRDVGVEVVYTLFHLTMGYGGRYEPSQTVQCCERTMRLCASCIMALLSKVAWHRNGIGMTLVAQNILCSLSQDKTNRRLLLNIAKQDFQIVTSTVGSIAWNFSSWSCYLDLHDMHPASAHFVADTIVMSCAKRYDSDK